VESLLLESGSHGGICHIKTRPHPVVDAVSSNWDSIVNEADCCRGGTVKLEVRKVRKERERGQPAEQAQRNLPTSSADSGCARSRAQEGFSFPSDVGITDMKAPTLPGRKKWYSSSLSRSTSGES
jgi:hypothetical protein